MTSFVVFAIALPIAIVGFALLDRWHNRRAWKRATEDAHEIMRRRRGL